MRRRAGHGFTGVTDDSIDRWRLSTLAERLVFGDAETFGRNDALELARLLPTMSSRAGLKTRLESSFFFRSMGPVPPGGGDGRDMREGCACSLDVDGRGRQVLRAGQWLFHRSANFIEFEQIAALDMTNRRTARLDLDGQEPTRLLVLNRTAGMFGTTLFAKDIFQAWKVPI